MKKLFIAAIIALTTACISHHTWMDKALVGYVDQQAVVLFDAGIRNGVKYYRPQFQSECQYNKAYFDEQSSTGCVINEARIADLHLYSEHIAKDLTKRVVTQINHDFMEGVSNPNHIRTVSDELWKRCSNRSVGEYFSNCTTIIRLFGYT